MSATRALRTVAAACAALLSCAGGAADAAPPPPAAPAVPAAPARVHKDSPALFGMGAQACKAFVDVAAETTGREIAISGAMFSWAQGWFSARNVVGHESAPRIVGGTLSADKLKSLLVEECRGHPDESLYLAVDDLYDHLARKGW
jgi:hypothetical protein